MKKFITILLASFSMLASNSQTITDTTRLRQAINLYIQPNGTNQINAAQLNRILNGVLNVLPGIAEGGGSFGVSTWKGRFGAVVPVSGDYSIGMITGGLDSIRKRVDSIWISGTNLNVKKFSSTVSVPLTFSNIAGLPDSLLTRLRISDTATIFSNIVRTYGSQTINGAKLFNGALTATGLAVARSLSSTDGAIDFTTGGDSKWKIGLGMVADYGANLDFHIFHDGTGADYLTIVDSTGDAYFYNAIYAGNGHFAGLSVNTARYNNLVTNYLTAFDCVVYCDRGVSGGDQTVYLPAISALTNGRLYMIKNMNAANTVTITANGSENFDGGSSTLVLQPYQSVILSGLGSSLYGYSWLVVGRDRQSTYGASTFTGAVTATSFIKSGGTSAQFLKADGSADANTYLTTASAASTYLTTAAAASTYLTTSSAGSTYVPFTGGSFTGQIFLPNNFYYGTKNTSNTNVSLIGLSSSDRVGIGLGGYPVDFSGKITSTVGNNLIAFENISATTGYLTLARAISTGANMALSIENSAGGTLATGSSAYATILGTYNATSLQNVTNGIVRQTINSTGNVVFEAPSTGAGVTINGKSGDYATYVKGNTTTGSSYALLVDGGTNSSDVAALIRNATGSTDYFKVRGDGNIYTTQDFGIGAVGFAQATANRRVLALNGTNSSLFEFQTGGTFRGYLFHNGTNFDIFHNAAGNIRAINTSAGVELTNGGTSWAAISDERKKEMNAFKPFTNAMDKLMALRTGIGRYKTDSTNVTRSFLIAQDVLKVLPQAVSVSNDKDKTLLLMPTELIPLIIAGQKEDHLYIQSVDAYTKSLEARIAAIEKSTQKSK